MIKPLSIQLNFYILLRSNMFRPCKVIIRLASEYFKKLQKLQLLEMRSNFFFYKFCLNFRAVLGTFGKLRKATISFFISISPSFSPHGTTRLSLDGYSLHFVFEYLSKKTVEKIQVSLKSDKNNGYLTRQQYIFLIISRSILLRMKNVSDKSCRENQNTYFVFSNFFFFVLKSCRL
jgi:hypothetical protein